MTNKAVFLDRDGTINQEVNYLSKIEEIKILPKVPGAIKLLNENGFNVIIITNQSGVERGYFSLESLIKINDHIVAKLDSEGAKVDGIYFCPHHPDSGCNCRKPKTGLLEKAEKDFEIDLTSSYMIGDKFIDLATGKNVGCKTILVLTGYGRQELLEKESWEFQPDYIADDLLNAVEWIIKEGGK
jgi:histidinol-phosphate phosphatase family protein